VSRPPSPPPRYGAKPHAVRSRSATPQRPRSPHPSRPHQNASRGPATSPPRPHSPQQSRGARCTPAAADAQASSAPAPDEYRRRSRSASDTRETERYQAAQTDCAEATTMPHARAHPDHADPTVVDHRRASGTRGHPGPRWPNRSRSDNQPRSRNQRAHGPHQIPHPQPETIARLGRVSRAALRDHAALHDDACPDTGTPAPDDRRDAAAASDHAEADFARSVRIARQRSLLARGSAMRRGAPQPPASKSRPAPHPLHPWTVAGNLYDTSHYRRRPFRSPSTSILCGPSAGRSPHHQGAHPLTTSVGGTPESGLRPDSAKPPGR
jgi:hypothetical protein